MIKKRFVLILTSMFIISITASVGSVSTVDQFWTLIDDDTLHTNNESWNLSIGKNDTTTYKLFVNGTSYFVDVVNVSSDLRTEYLRSNDNENTNIRFLNNRIFFNADGVNTLYTGIFSPSNYYLGVGGEGNDVDFFVLNGLENYLFYANCFSNGGVGAVGIGTRIPSEKLDVLGGIKLTDDLTFGSQRVYNGSSDLYINNSEYNKDIIFQINGLFTDGYSDFVTIDSSTGTFVIDKGTFDGTTGTPIFKVTGNAGASSSISIVNKYDLGMTKGSGYLMKSDVNMLSTTVGNINLFGYNLGTVWREPVGDKEQGVTAFSFVPSGFSWFQYTGNSSFSNIGYYTQFPAYNLYPSGAHPTQDIIEKGAYFKRDRLNIPNVLGGSINDVIAWGIDLEGWNHVSDNFDGVNGDISKGAIRTDGGDTYFGEGEHTFIGDVNVSGIINNSVIYAQLSDSTDQTFGSTGVGYAITFNTNDEINGIIHSTVSEPQNITIVTSGVYSIVAQPQVHADPGASGYFHMWLRRNTGGGFVDVANSNVELTLNTNDEDVIPLIVTMSLNAGDIIRVNASVSHTGIELDAQTPVDEPAIPSIIFSMYRIGA